MPSFKYMVIIFCLIKRKYQQAKYYLRKVVKMWLGDQVFMTMQSMTIKVKTETLNKNNTLSHYL